MGKLLTRTGRFLDKRSTAFHVVLAFSLVFALAFLDYLAGGQIGFTVFFLIPVVISTWYVGRWLGVITAAFSSFLWFPAALSLGQYFPASAEPYYLWNALMRLMLFLIVIYMVWRLKEALEHETELSRTDPLTGAVNRRYFRELADTEIWRAGRYGHPFSLAYLDLDRFKEVNDMLGHSAGDRVLRLVVKTMEHGTRSNDVVARLGGDEFAVLLPETGADQAKGAIDHLQSALLAVMDEHDWPVTFSIGLATFDEPPASVNDMIKVADKLMYSVKDTTKNAIKSSVVE